jgi:hypothetical protein
VTDATSKYVCSKLTVTPLDREKAEIILRGFPAGTFAILETQIVVNENSIVFAAETGRFRRIGVGPIPKDMETVQKYKTIDLSEAQRIDLPQVRATASPR